MQRTQKVSGAWSSKLFLVISTRVCSIAKVFSQTTFSSTYSLGKVTTEKSENTFPFLSFNSLSATAKLQSSRIAARVFP